MGVLRTFYRMIPRIRAEESLAEVEIGTIAAGNASPESKQRTLNRWRAATGHVETQAPLKATPQDLKGFGVGTRPWPKTPAPTPEVPA